MRLKAETLRFERDRSTAGEGIEHSGQLAVVALANLLTRQP